MSHAHILFQHVIFFIFAGITLFSALMVVTLNNPVRCVLFLVVAFVSSAGMWILAHAEFLALILVLVYVGAVMTLFLFVVMMLDVEQVSQKRHFVRYLPFGMFVIALLVALMIQAIKPEHFGLIQATSGHLQNSLSNTVRLGRVLYTDYAYALECAGVLLLIAIISSIALTHRTIKRSKQQNIMSQLMASSDERIKLVSGKNKHD